MIFDFFLKHPRWGLYSCFGFNCKSSVCFGFQWKFLHQMKIYWEIVLLRQRLEKYEQIPIWEQKMRIGRNEWKFYSATRLVFFQIFYLNREACLKGEGGRLCNVLRKFSGDGLIILTTRIYSSYDLEVVQLNQEEKELLNYLLASIAVASPIHQSVKSLENDFSTSSCSDDGFRIVGVGVSLSFVFMTLAVMISATLTVMRSFRLAWILVMFPRNSHFYVDSLFPLTVFLVFAFSFFRLLNNVIVQVLSEFINYLEKIEYGLR